MQSFPTDPLEGLDYDYAEDSKNGFKDSLFSEPSWMEAAKSFDKQRPSLPSSDLSIPNSYYPKKKKKGNESLNSTRSDMSSTGLSQYDKSVKKYTMPNNKIADPKASELLNLCRSGWTLSRGQKHKPVMGRINPGKIENDIQQFADRYSDAKSKASSSKGTDLNSPGERFQPQVWPNKDSIHCAKGKNRSCFQTLRAPKPMKSTLGNSSFTFPQDIRMHPGVYPVNL